MPIERLGVRDAVNLSWGESGPGGVLLGWVALINRGDLEVADDAEAVARLTATVAAHLDRLPRLRQRVQRLPLGLGLPIWTDDLDFSIERHVGTRAIDAPGDDADLWQAVEALFGQPLPLDRPLWHIEILTGLAGDRIALVQRIHHTLADGVAGAAIAAALLDTEAATFMAAVLPPRSPPPGCLALLVDNLRWRARMLVRLAAAAWHPAHTVERVRLVFHEAWTLLRRGRDRQPTSLNQPLGPRRASHVLDIPLAAVKRAGHAAGATVNDVLLAAVAGGLRALLDARGESIDTATLYASVPVSIRTDDAATLGNRTAGLLIDVRVDVGDARQRLAAIAEDTRRQKEQRAWVGLAGVMDSPWVPSWFHRHATHWLRNQRMINVMVSNVPGPATPLRIAGAPIRTVLPVLPIAVNVPIGVAAISYAGRLVLGVRTEPDLVPDVDVFLTGLEAALQRLGVAAAAPVP